MGSLDVGWKCSDFTLGTGEKPWKVGGLRALAFSGSAECLVSYSCLVPAPLFQAPCSWVLESSLFCDNPQHAVIPATLLGLLVTFVYFAQVVLSRDRGVLQENVQANCPWRNNKSLSRCLFLVYDCSSFFPTALE